MAQKKMKLDLDKGAFTKKAKAAGLTVNQYATKVLKTGSKATAKTKKQAQFVKNASKWK